MTNTNYLAFAYQGHELIYCMITLFFLSEVLLDWIFFIHTWRNVDDDTLCIWQTLLLKTLYVASHHFGWILDRVLLVNWQFPILCLLRRRYDDDVDHCIQVLTTAVSNQPNSFTGLKKIIRVSNKDDSSTDHIFI